METPYGEIPDNLVKDMSLPEMHDYLKRRYGRRSVLKAAGAIGLAAAAGPVFWRQSPAFASTASAPQWIAYGADPTTQMYVSWSTGTYNGTNQAPRRPQVRWGRDDTYGGTQAAESGTVPIPASVPGETAENTIYNHTLLVNLAPNTTYHYSVSNDGVTWSDDTIFTTAEAEPSDFRFTMVGDEAASLESTLPIAQSIASFKPKFNVVVGDLSYAGGGNGYYADGQITGASTFTAGLWDTYLGIIGPAAAQSIPWMVSVGNHEMEPLADFGYAGFLTRFPQPYARERVTGSPVVQTFTYGNVAIIQLDGNDLSAEIPDNNGYTDGKQTAWLQSQLAAYRAPGSGIDFIVVGFHNCMFCTNNAHGSDGGIRPVWEPLFDQYQVDLVVNGHNHCYERTNPMIAGKSTRDVLSGGTVDPATDGTTYICAGGGGQGLYTDWLGPTEGGDPETITAYGPYITVWSGGTTAKGGSGTAGPILDTSTDFSAYRHANWSFIVLDVTAPTWAGGPTSLLVRAIDPTQNATEITTIASPAVIDSVTLTKASGRRRLHHLPPPRLQIPTSR